MFPMPSDEVRDQVLWEGRGEHLLLEDTCMKALDSAVQVNVEVTSIPYGKASCRKGFQNFTELYVRTLHTSLTLLLQGL